MNPTIQRKEFVSGLIDILNLAIDKSLLDDADVVLASIRLLRPKLLQLDMFEGWIAMRRRRWSDAARILGNLNLALPEFETARAFLAVCQYSSGDPVWRTTAADILENSSSVEALDIVRTLLAPDGEFSQVDNIADTTTKPPTPLDNLIEMSMHTAYRFRA